ncbi:hypothetical protein GYA25_00445 [Candidatus Woesearchaeota archaeon]|jgi:hypothetical protein|nr:hypothetical protein [Candidatus Woesearchaeota archaeon]
MDKEDLDKNNFNRNSFNKETLDKEELEKKLGNKILQDELLIGKKVKCIDGLFEESLNIKLPYSLEEINIPIQGKNYTIREVIETPFGLCVLLNEIKNKTYYFVYENKIREPMFFIERFKILK